MTFGNLDNFAFNSCDTSELNCINSGIEIEELPSTKNTNEGKISNISGENKIDANIFNKINCKYYSVNEFQDLKKDSNLNIFHNNVNGLESKFESLHHFFSNNPELDIINITETSQNFNNEIFKSNINLQGYSYYSTPSNSSLKKSNLNINHGSQTK